MDARSLAAVGGGAVLGYGLGMATGESAWAALAGAVVLFAIVAPGGPVVMGPDIESSSGGGNDEASGAGSGAGAEIDAKIWAAVAYARKYGYTITDSGSYLYGQLMRCDPMGAVALHATLGTCTWKYCDIIQTAADALGVDKTWVMAFHDGFRKDSWDDGLPDVYAIGLAWRPMVGLP